MVAYKVDFSYKNKLELLEIVMSLYSKTVLNKEISSKEKTVLREYILHGYSKETKDSIVLDLEITTSNLNTVNYALQKKGFLEPHPKNQRLKLLNEDLKKLRDCFTSQDKKKMFLVNFVKNEGQ